MARTPARKAAPLDLDALLPVRDRTLRWREPDSNYWSRYGETSLSTQCGLRARLHQLGEALIPGETKSSNPVSSSGESANFRSLARPMPAASGITEAILEAPSPPCGE